MAKDIVPLTSAMEAPKILEFPADEFTEEAFRFHRGVNCEVDLTIDKKGRATRPEAARCSEPAMVTPAVQSLLDSHFTPARSNGQAIAVRAKIVLAYLGSGSPY